MNELIIRSKDGDKISFKNAEILVDGHVIDLTESVTVVTDTDSQELLIDVGYVYTKDGKAVRDGMNFERGTFTNWRTSGDGI